MEEFEHLLIWEYISQYQILSENFIARHIHQLWWSLICQYQVLAEDFMRLYKYDIYWHVVAKHQVLSEEFIEEFILKFDSDTPWIDLAKRQGLSLQFIYKNRKYIPTHIVLKHIGRKQYILNNNNNNASLIALLKRITLKRITLINRMENYGLILLNKQQQTNNQLEVYNMPYNILLSKLV